MVVNGRRLFRHKFGQAFDEPLYAWVVEGKSARHCVSSLARRFVFQVNGMPVANSDGLLYHFTSHTALQSVLRSGELWLTDYRRLNDANEIHHALSVARETFAEFNDELSPQSQSLLRSAIDAPIPGAFFVACFSLLRDSPTHWCEFAARGEGVAIGFEPLGFLRLAATDARAITLTRVAYESTIKKGLFLSMAVLLDEVLRLDQERGLYDRHEYQAELQRFLPELLPLCKEDAFELEHEVRLLVIPELSMTGVAAEVPIRQRCTDRSIEFIGTRDLLRDFVLPIAKVVVGPRADDATFRSVRECAGREGFVVERV